MKFDEFLQQAAQLEGLVWRKYRRPPARRAVEARMGELGLVGFERYLELLRHDAAELAGLADLMHITVTRFFRDSDCWQTLAGAVLPGMLADMGERRTLAAWSAGCCGGEEPYTLAMIWLDMAPHREAVTLDITASDIDEASLERARHACYEKGSLREVPADFLCRFFRKEKGRFCLTEEVTALVNFEKRNIMSDPLPSGIDLAFCRYMVFTYYRGAKVRAAAERLWGVLRPGGVLVIGKKEELPEEAGAFFSPLPGQRSFFLRRG